MRDECKGCENRIIAKRVREQLRLDSGIAEKDEAGVYRPAGIDATIRRKAVNNILKVRCGSE